MNKVPLQNCNDLFNHYKILQMDGDHESIWLVHLRKECDVKIVCERRVVYENCAGNSVVNLQRFIVVEDGSKTMIQQRSYAVVW